MLRRFIPKGKSSSDYDADDICFFADCINGLPRKILGYRTPEMMFESFLDAIYAAWPRREPLALSIRGFSPLSVPLRQLVFYL